MNIFRRLYCWIFGCAKPIAPPIAPPIAIARDKKTRFGLEISYDEHWVKPNFGDLKPGYARIDAAQNGEEDVLVAALAAEGVKLLLIAPYVYTRDPRSVTAQAALVGAIAARYADLAWGMELFNEPNLPMGSNGGSRAYTPEQYMEYAIAMARAIRAAAPRMKVVLGGASGIDMRWYSALADLGAMNLVDVIGFHPYGSNVKGVVYEIEWLARIFPMKPLMCTEHPDVAIHEAMDGYVDASIIFTLRDHSEFALIRPPSTIVDAARYDRAKALLNR